MSSPFEEQLTHLKNLTKSKSFSQIKNYLESLPHSIKGGVFEQYLGMLFKGNGWHVEVKGGKGDVGADILPAKRVAQFPQVCHRELAVPADIDAAK